MLRNTLKRKENALSTSNLIHLFVLSAKTETGNARLVLASSAIEDMVFNLLSFLMFVSTHVQCTYKKNVYLLSCFI